MTDIVYLSKEEFMRILPTRTCLVSEGRSEVNGERWFSRTYVTPSGREIVVKTVMEMENVSRRETRSTNPSPRTS